jgi:hypothetical protein
MTAVSMKALMRHRADDADGADREFFTEQPGEERRARCNNVVSVVSTAAPRELAGRSPAEAGWVLTAAYYSVSIVGSRVSRSETVSKQNGRSRTLTMTS